MDGLAAGSVVPVIKHIPGHGRATSDSHHDLPIVATSVAELEATDFEPFRKLKDAPVAMTAHVVFTALDAGRPASTSPLVTQQIIRGSIGFDGLLMSDDLSMRALSGPLGERALAVLAAGSDLALHCNGDLREMEQVAAATPPLSGKALVRFERALTVTATREPLDRMAAEASLAEALSILA
jgi:beta-N-acetylhexosaminidase